MIAHADKIGTCGDNITWTLNESTGTLTIEGSGAMEDFSYSTSVPWYEDIKSVTTVVIGDGVTNIGQNAFYGCSKLISVIIGNNVKSIGSDAFYKCSGLPSVTIPNSVTSIGSGAFGGCKSLTSVTIPNSVTSIGGGTFSGCSGLISIAIPNSVTSISGRTFFDCSGLTSVTIPNSVTNIDDWAFSGCSGLKKVIVSDIAAWCSIKFGSNANPLNYAHHLYNDENTEIMNLIIPNGVTSISEQAFIGCSCLTSVTIPNSVTNIGEGAFSYCSGLTSVTIPNSVTSIGRSAFHGCSGLISITIPNSVTSINNEAFYNCPCLTSIQVESGNTKYDSRNTCNAIIETASNTLVVGCKGTVIPNSVTSISEGAFWGCTGLTSITIGNSVTSIGRSAFYECSGLTSVTIPNSVTNIGEGAFSYCSGLKKVIVSDIAAWCGIKFNGGYANPLSYANHLYSDENTEIKNLIIPNGVTSICDRAFDGCSGLTSVIIPNSVTSIGVVAFRYCFGLTSITIPNSVTSIKSEAFYGVDFLTIISLIENPFFVNNYVFSPDTFYYATLYVPKGTIDKYKATSYWNWFKYIVEGNPTGINVVENKKHNNTTIYDLNGVRQLESKKGINIVNGKKVVMK